MATLCWLLIAAVGLLAAVRALGLDLHFTPLIGLSTAWPLVVLPGLLAGLGAAYLRRKALAGATALVLAVGVLAWWPCWVGAVGAGAPGGVRLRVLALNVEHDHDTGAAASRQIRQQNPDIVVLSELSPLTLRHLELTQYPYSWQRPSSGAFGEGVWSRWPLVARNVWWTSKISMLRMTVDLPGGPVRLYQVHTLSPQGARGRRVWQEQLTQLRRYLAAERLPVVVAGDFNASRWDRPFGRLLGGATRMADAGTGRGYLATWPSGRSWLPPVLPLDHVLVSHGIGVRGLRVLGPVGSDHRAVVADLSVPT